MVAVLCAHRSFQVTDIDPGIPCALSLTVSFAAMAESVSPPRTVYDASQWRLFVVGGGFGPGGGGSLIGPVLLGTHDPPVVG
jgi:hypothetical protein